MRAFKFVSFMVSLKNAASSEVILFCWSLHFVEWNKILVSSLCTRKYRLLNITKYTRSTGKLQQFCAKTLILKKIGESVVH